MTALKIAAFLRRNSPMCREWPKEELVRWVRWLCAIEAVAVVTNGKRLQAVGVARPVCSIAEAANWYRVSPGGTILWVDLAVSHNPRATGDLLRIARQRWGERLMVAFYRQKWAKTEVLPWRYFMGRFTKEGI